MRKTIYLLAFLLLVFSPVALAQDEAPPQLDVTQYELENGLKVILVEDHSAPTVAVNLRYNVGGANDADGLTGFAHLFEHMMFQGSAHITKGGHFEYLTEIGADTNAYTSRDQTTYYEALPSHYLPLALWMEADRMASLDVNAENLENQRAVVLEEYQQSYSNQPYTGINFALLTETFDYVPYQNLPIGRPEDIMSASLADVLAFHETYYVPNNATLIVAGDIDVEVAQDLIEEYFGAIPAGETPPQLPVYEASARTEERRVELQDAFANVPAVFIGYAIPPREDPDYTALEVLSLVLSFGNSSRFALNLQDTGEALFAGAFTDGNIGPSLFSIYALPGAGVSLEEIEQAMYDELAAILEEGVPAEELEKVINLTRSSRILSLETAADLAESTQDAVFYFDDPQAVYTEIDRLSEVTSEDIQRVITEYLTPERRSVFTATPGGDPPTALEDIEAEPLDTDTEVPPPAFVLEQSEPPEPLPITEFALPNITEKTLDNGLNVIVVEQPGLPVISLDLYLPGGDSATPADLAGLADLTATLLPKGTDSRSAAEIAQTIEQVGGFIGASSSRDSLTVGLLALQEDSELGFELLSDVVFNPTFPEDNFAVERDAYLSSIDLALSEPDSIASRTFFSTIYGTHPYGQNADRDSLEMISREDVIDFYQSQLSPEGALLFVVGDFTYDDVAAMVEQYFGEWPDTAAQPLTYEAPPVQTGQQIFLVNRPGSTQAQFAIGNVALMGNNPDRQSASVMNGVLGGTAASRLFLTVREELGYTYGIYSGVSFPADQGYFIVSGSAGNETAALALEEILNQLEVIRTDPVTDDELNLVKSGLIGSFALNLETYQSFIDTLASFKLRGLDIEELSNYLGAVEAVDGTAVTAAAQEVISLDDLVIVVVGDADALQAGLEEIAPVTLLEAE